MLFLIDFHYEYLGLNNETFLSIMDCLKRKINQMKDKYNKEIDDIYTQDFLIASILMENRYALVLYGENINITHL